MKLVARVLRALMNALHRFFAQTFGQAEDVARHRVNPRLLEVDRLVGLDREIGTMSLEQSFGGGPWDVGVAGRGRRQESPCAAEDLAVQQ
nr:hypothetical protein [Calidifontibacter indicus]